MRDIKFRARNRSTGDILGQSYQGQCFYWVSCEHQESIIIEQFTGLQDIKGNDIYEGDVVYIAGCGDYTCEFPFIELYEAMAENDIGNILGNIHENPELLLCC